MQTLLLEKREEEEAAAAEPASTLDSVQREITHLPLSPREVRARALDTSSSDVAQQKKRKVTPRLLLILGRLLIHSVCASFSRVIKRRLLILSVRSSVSWLDTVNSLTSDTLLFDFLVAFYLLVCPHTDS